MSDDPFFPCQAVACRWECMHRAHLCLLFAILERAQPSTKQLTVLDHNWIESADIAHSIVLHKQPTPQISAWSLPPSKIRSCTTHWQIQAYCEPSASQHALRHYPKSPMAGARRRLYLSAFHFVYTCRLIPASLGIIDVCPTCDLSRAFGTSWASGIG